jgi:hypothetical protein
MRSSTTWVHSLGLSDRSLVVKAGQVAVVAPAAESAPAAEVFVVVVVQAVAATRRPLESKNPKQNR